MNHPSKTDWDDVRVFIEVARSGSFRRSGAQLGIGHTTIARRISRLERAMGTRLFDRLPSGLLLTDAGKALREGARGLEENFAELEVRAFGFDTEAKGKIRFTVPAMLLSHLLLEPIVAFRRQWPSIEIEFNDSLDILDLSAKEADLALRVTNSPAETLIGRRVGEYCEAAYASRQYLEQRDRRSSHAWLYPGGKYTFPAKMDANHAGDLEPVLTLADPETQVSGALQHLGVATLPCLIAVRHPELVRISEVVHRSSIWLLAHQDARGNRRLQLFRDFLVEQMMGFKDVLEGQIDTHAT